MGKGAHSHGSSHSQDPLASASKLTERIAYLFIIIFIFAIWYVAFVLERARTCIIYDHCSCNICAPKAILSLASFAKSSLST